MQIIREKKKESKLFSHTVAKHNLDRTRMDRLKHCKGPQSYDRSPKNHVGELTSLMEGRKISRIKYDVKMEIYNSALVIIF